MAGTSEGYFRQNVGPHISNDGDRYYEEVNGGRKGLLDHFVGVKEGLKEDYNMEGVADGDTSRLDILTYTVCNSLGQCEYHTGMQEYCYGQTQRYIGCQMEVLQMSEVEHTLASALVLCLQ